MGNPAISKVHWFGTGVMMCSPLTNFDTVIGVFTDDSCQNPTCLPLLSVTNLVGEVSNLLFAVNDYVDSCIKDGMMTATGASMVVWDSKEGHIYNLYVSCMYG